MTHNLFRQYLLQYAKYDRPDQKKTTTVDLNCSGLHINSINYFFNCFFVESVNWRFASE